MGDIEEFDLSVVIPALNEGGNIGSIVSEFRSVLDGLGVNYEILVIDGGSTDGTREEAQSAGASCRIQRRTGYGGALCEGIIDAKGKYVLTLDADCSHPPELVERLWEVREEADIVIGSRLVPGGCSDAPEIRKALTSIVNSFFSKALAVPVHDSSSGYRLYRRAILTPELYTAENFSIQQEILILAYSNGYQMVEVPFHFLRRNEGSSHVQWIRFTCGYIKTFFRLWKLRNSVEAADYDHRAYHSRIPFQRYWQRSRCRIVNEFLEKGALLDVGCGSSQIIQGHPEAIAFDVAHRKLRFLRKTNQLLVRGSTFQLPFSDKSFEQVIHSQVIEHVPFDKLIFRELNRVLLKGGVLVIGTPDYGRIWWPIIEFFYGTLLPNAYADEHVTHYTREKLIDLLTEHGFQVLEYKYICGGELIIKARKVEE